MSGPDVPVETRPLSEQVQPPAAVHEVPVETRVIALLAILVAAVVSVFTWVPISLARAFVAVLWAAYKSKIVLGVAIFGFSVSGLAMVIGSRAVTGWNQTALLGFGTSFLVVGTVELGILGVLNKIIDPDHAGDLIKDLSGDLAQRFTALENWLGMPTSQRAEFGESLKLRPGRPDGGIADDGDQGQA